MVDLEAHALKRLTAELEKYSGLVRLFDMDVLTPAGEKLDREALGMGERRCLIRGAPARACARSRAYTVETLRRETTRLLEGTLKDYDAKRIAELA